jgi:hypothetical protein
VNAMNNKLITGLLRKLVTKITSVGPLSNAD